jgi:hypothetical protein
MMTSSSRERLKPGFASKRHEIWRAARLRSLICGRFLSGGLNFLVQAQVLFARIALFAGLFFFVRGDAAFVATVLSTRGSLLAAGEFGGLFDGHGLTG